MKSFIVAACIVACVYAAATSDQEAVIVSSKYQLAPEGSYEFGFEANNGIKGGARAAVKTVGTEVALEVTGSNSYTAPDGQVISVTYVANENGFQPQGSHLPTPPPAEPIPEYIRKALEYIAAHPYTEPKNEAIVA